MIEVTRGDLRRAYDRHYRFAIQGVETTHYLLLFYAAECGLKAIYIDREIKPNDKDFNKIIKEYSHDLIELMKALKISGRFARVHPVRIKRGSKQITLKEIHEVWRYGVELETEDQQMIINWLKQVNLWIGENS